MPPKKEVTGEASSGTDLTALIKMMQDREDRLQREAQAREDRLMHQLQDQQAQFQAMVDRVAQGTGSGGPGAGAGAVPAAGTSGARVPKMDIPVLGKPNDVSLPAFKEYRRRLEGYANVQKLRDLDRVARMQVVTTGIDGEWLRLRNETQALIVDENNDDINNMLTKMRAYLRRHRNPLRDRLDFLCRSQLEGERVDEYYAALMDIHGDCDFGEVLECRACHADSGLATVVRDERIRDRIICGLRDPTTQEKILAEEFATLTLGGVLNRARAEESAKNTRAQLENPAGVQSVRRSAYRQQKSGQTKSNQKDEQKAGVQCYRCKGFGHISKNCATKEPAKELVKAQAAVSAEEPKATTGRIYVASISGDEELVPLTTFVGDRWADIPWMLDTGAAVNVIGLKELNALGLTQANLGRAFLRLHSADQKEMTCLGKVRATITRGTVAHEADVFVVEQLRSPLLGKHMCKKLRFVPEKFPHAWVNELSVRKDRVPVDMAPESTASEPDKARYVSRFPEVFPSDDRAVPLMAMDGPEMRIELVPGAKPVKRYKANTIPFHWQGTVKQRLDDMEAKDVVERVPPNENPDWIMSLVVVPKAGSNEPRLTVDFTPMNPYIKRSPHPGRVPAEEVAQIPHGMRWFTVLDKRHGYWQVKLDEESKKLCAFITPFGLYRFKRNAMGMICAGDEHNRRGDEALRDIGNVRVIVDDILIYDETYEGLQRRVEQVLQRCRDHHISLSEKKCHFSQRAVTWCGYRISEAGYTASPDLVEALAKFPVPANKTDVKAFSGLVNQFEALSPDLTEMMTPLRALTKKDAAFLWEAPQQQAFKAVITELQSPRVLTQYRPEAPLRLETDAAQKTGLGYALWQQEPDGRWRLMRCGSRAVTQAESRYSITESELLGLTWAVKKLRLYLRGRPFDAIVDHKPLEGIVNGKPLDSIETPRILRLKEKLAGYLPRAVWRPGIKHVVVDVFSRYPVAKPEQEDLEGENEIEDYAKHFTLNRIGADRTLERVRVETDLDTALTKLKETIQQGFPEQKAGLDDDLKEFWGVRHELSVVDSLIMYKAERIVVPKSMRREVLKDLHAAHQGQKRAFDRAKQCVYWPHIIRDLENTVKTCGPCQRHQPSQQKEPLMQDEPATRPGESIAADLFEVGGRHFLVITDKYSGWPEVYKYDKTTTTEDTAYRFRLWMAAMGVPVRLTTDGGPQFKGREFAQFCQEWGISHDPSSPYHHIANGYAEAAVKCMQDLIKKISPSGELNIPEFAKAKMEYRNTPRKDGLSPAQRLFGRPMRTTMPSHPLVFKRSVRKEIREADKKAAKLREKAKVQYDSTAKELSKLRVGTIVRVQHMVHKTWDLVGEVVEVDERGRSYLVRSETGRLYWRNRRFLRRYRPEANMTKTQEDSQAVQGPRRSGRERKKPKKLMESM